MAPRQSTRQHACGWCWPGVGALGTASGQLGAESLPPLQYCGVLTRSCALESEAQEQSQRLFSSAPPGTPWRVPLVRTTTALEKNCALFFLYAAGRSQRTYYYGIPNPIKFPQDALYESSARYLRRLGLLLPGEDAIIPQDLDACDEWFIGRYEFIDAHPR